MDHVTALQKLIGLQRSGAVSDEAFSQAQAIARAHVDSSPDDETVVRQLLEQLATARRENALAQLELKWEAERDKFLIDDQGKRILPSSRDGLNFMIAGGVIAGMGAILFACIFIGLLPFWIFPIPLWFVFLVAVAVCVLIGWERYTMGKKYERGLAAYQFQREAIQAGVFEVDAVGSTSSAPPGDLQIAQQIAETQCQAELARLDREWLIEYQKHLMKVGRRGARTLPTKEAAKSSALGGLIVGGAIAIWGASWGAVVFGLIIAVFGIGAGIYQYFKVLAYERAFADYQSKRKRLQPENSR